MRAWLCLGMKDQHGGHRESEVSRELRHKVWGDHTGQGRGVAPAVLSASQEQEGAIVDSRCWQGHRLAGVGSGRMCIDKPLETVADFERRDVGMA